MSAEVTAVGVAAPAARMQDDRFPVFERVVLKLSGEALLSNRKLSTTTREEYIDRITRGGFPLAGKTPPIAPMMSANPMPIAIASGPVWKLNETSLTVAKLMMPVVTLFSGSTNRHPMMPPSAAPPPRPDASW